MRCFVLLMLLASPAWADTWPEGLSLEDVRAIRECTPSEAVPGPGEPISCRPSVRHGGLQWRFGVDWSTGIVRSDAPVSGGAQGLGVDLDFTFARRFAVGARYELLGIGTPRYDGAIELRRTQRIYGQARWRLFTDEVDRDGFALAAGFGRAFQPQMLGGDAAAARVAVSREVGWLVDDRNSFAFALEVAYERSLGDVGLETLLVSARTGLESRIAEPRNLGTPDEDNGRLWSSGALFALPSHVGIAGAEVSVGVRLVSRLHAIAAGSFARGNQGFGDGESR